MSAASRLARADTRILRPRDERTGKFRAPAELARNGGLVVGGLGAVPRGVDFTFAGLTWQPNDANPWASPIGYALADESAGQDD